jgi:hypothetical protein
LVGLAGLLALVGALVSAPAALAGSPDPNAGAYGPPPATHLTPAGAFAIASKTTAARSAANKYGTLHAVVCAPGTPACATACWPKCAEQWQVLIYDAHRLERAEVRVDDRSATVTEAWTGIPLGWGIARGIPGFLGNHVNALYVWLPLCLLFIAPFVDFRNPFRLLHLDLLVLLGFSVSQVFFNRGNIAASVPLVYPVLAYLLVRLTIAGLRPRRRTGALIPHARASWLIVGLVCLTIFRVAFNLADSTPGDIGTTSAQTATKLAHGQLPYGNRSGDAYGPLTYVAYLPFVEVWPSVKDSIAGKARFAGDTFTRVRDPAVRPAAIVFDLLTLFGLLALGRRLRPGREGRTLGLGLAYAWASYPYALYGLESNTNDALVSALLVATLIVFARPSARIAGIFLATAAKFSPGVLIPLFVLADGRRETRRRAFFALAAAAVVGLLLLVVDGGFVSGMVNAATYQVRRTTPFSIWGSHPGLSWLHVLFEAGTVGLALWVAFAPGGKTAAQVAGLGAAVLVASQLTLGYWFYYYIVWFAPYALVAVFSEYSVIAGDSPVAAESEAVDGAPPTRVPTLTSVLARGSAWRAARQACA